MVPENFSKWARSLAGCDGGNEGAATWLCGIEWGGGTDGDGRYYTHDLPAEIAKGPVTDYSRVYDWQVSLTYRYGLAFSKLFAAIHGHDVSASRQFVQALNGSEVFKLNLYPIAFDSTDATLWRKYGLDQLTGFGEKHLFQTWCFYNRFPAIAELTRARRPKLIIGTGTSYLREFFACFGGTPEQSSQIQYGEIGQNAGGGRSSRRYYWSPVGVGSILVVVPFLSGRYGLNSDALIQEMGTKIRAVMGPAPSSA